jgi:hypothetical protein
VTCDRSVVFSGYSTNKTDHHDITEILLKVALSTINQTKPKSTFAKEFSKSLKKKQEYKIIKNKHYFHI